jgi:hypothetical protein
MAADEEGGEFYNLEATVAYHALPSSNDVSSKARNMGMQLVFYLGIKGLFGVPFPICKRSLTYGARGSLTRINQGWNLTDWWLPREYGFHCHRTLLSLKR